jgi:uracil-DNA glycosylase
MVNQAEQQYYLNAIGLPQWRLRRRGDKTDNNAIIYIPSALAVSDSNMSPTQQEQIPPVETVADDKKVFLSVPKNVSEQIKQHPQQLESEVGPESDLNSLKISTQDSKLLGQTEPGHFNPQLPKQEKTNIAVQTELVNQTLTADFSDNLENLSKQVSSCHLCEKRLNAQQSLKTQVLNVSKQTSKTILLLVDEPSIIEYQQGSFLTEQYQSLLQAIFQGVNLDVTIYISSVLKCLSAENYQPVAQELLKQELNNCLGFLKQELSLIQPDVIVTLGLIQMQSLVEGIEDEAVLEGLIGQSFEVKKSLSKNKSIPIIPTFHPAFLYRNPLFKAKALQNWITIAKIIEN